MHLSKKEQNEADEYMNPNYDFKYSTISSACGLGLITGLVGGFFRVFFQTLLTNFYTNPRIQAEIAEEIKMTKKERVIKQAERNSKNRNKELTDETCSF